MMPTLLPQVSRWAADRGLTPPNRVLEAVFGPDPAVIASIIDLLGPVAGSLRRDRPDLDRSAAELSRGWSAGEPTRYVNGLARAVDEVLAVVESVQTRLTPFLGELAAVQQLAAGAVATVHAACDWSGYVVWDSDQGLVRTAACTVLCRELTSADQRIRTAVIRLDGVFTLDPRAPIEALPVPGGFVPVQLVPRATVTAAGNRARAVADLAAPELDTRRFAASVLRDLDEARAVGGHADLLLYEPGTFHGQGRAAISVGEIATADHVAVLTPGIGNSPSAMGSTLTVAQALRTAAEQGAPGERTAVVAWFGYDIPLSWPQDGGFNPVVVATDSLAAADADVARRGGELLSTDLARIRGLAPEWASLVAVGHSMGAVTTSEAGRFPVPVDALVLLAAPGSGHDTRRAQQYLSTPAPDVFVLSHPADPVTLRETDILAGVVSGPSVTGPFGGDPASIEFGAQVIDVPSNRPMDLLGHDFKPDLRQHALGNYLAGAGLLAVAGIVTGRTSRVPRKRGR